MEKKRCRICGATENLIRHYIIPKEMGGSDTPDNIIILCPICRQRFLQSMLAATKRRLRCYHCGYEWEYKGSSEFYATCPRCLRKVKIEKARIKMEEEKGETS